ncbi:uncharacterized protein L969DRAFT_93520 [Mixia osmundae IAM 14324]|uniref:Uncharacterized protein n=1 Tax=Mixia osmundae (strain CBS 9802 / IAM 14324 / JCM 22182 / KY 12970) TaxID=764103 RepID=G7DU77_MIXOS|nr:uncharacterized protein L969DRAFT_93520 [Mixia osmundae IAM 14324]KEI41004.1 hypothetical protein L969DRAFT_93520 [Mixia osmundae IAM 14324]GAA94137.1 hypothetical protein E5Q_00785 [Mixia osmundae IAM 14324]
MQALRRRGSSLVPADVKDGHAHHAWITKIFRHRSPVGSQDSIPPTYESATASSGETVRLDNLKRYCTSLVQLPPDLDDVPLSTLEAASTQYEQARELVLEQGVEALIVRVEATESLLKTLSDQHRRALHKGDGASGELSERLDIAKELDKNARSVLFECQSMLRKIEGEQLRLATALEWVIVVD